MIDHAFLGKITDAAHRLVRYWKMRQEIKRFKSCRNVHELPAIFHYWSNKYLVYNGLTPEFCVRRPDPD